MPTQNPPQAHHYLPQFYLKRWLDPVEKKLCEYSRLIYPGHDDVVSNRVSPKGTGYKRELYTLRGYEPKLAQQVETEFFGTIDGDASDALELMYKYGSKAKWDDRLRTGWTMFLLSLLLRMPEDIEKLRENHRQNYLGTSPELEAKYQSLRTDGDPATFAEFMAEEPVVERERHMWDIFYSLIGHKKIGPEIANMHWVVLDFPEHTHELMTSDRPVMRTFNLASPGIGHLALPIGPRKMFVACVDHEMVRRICASSAREVAKENNRQAIQGAMTYAYARNDAQLAFVKRHFGTKPQPRLIDGFGERFGTNVWNGREDV